PAGITTISGQSAQSRKVSPACGPRGVSTTTGGVRTVVVGGVRTGGRTVVVGGVRVVVAGGVGGKRWVMKRSIWPRRLRHVAGTRARNARMGATSLPAEMSPHCVRHVLQSAGGS